MKILEALVERPGDLVSREELRDRLWAADTFVDFDKSLNVAVAKLRQVLNDSADLPRYIETVPRKGYRFIAPLTENALPEGSPSDRAKTPARMRLILRRSVWVAAAVTIGWMIQRGSGSKVDGRLIQLDLEVGKSVSQPAITPDGTAMAFITDGRLAVRRMDSGSVKLLPGTEGASSPFFSPDGKAIAYFAGLKLRRINVDGGEASIVCDAPADRGGTWTEGGRIIAALGDSGVLYFVKASGGTPQPFTTMQREPSSLIQLRRPRVLPGSGGILFIASTGVAAGTVQVVGPDGGSARTLVADASGAWYLPGGYLIYQRGGALFAATFDVQRLQITGQPWPILDGVSHDYFRGGDVDVSLAGTLVYRANSVAGNRKVVWLEPEGGTSDGDLPAPGPYFSPRFSDDGKRLALAAEADGQAQIWAFELGRGRLTLLTHGQARCCPVWTRDGQYLVFGAGRSLSWTRWDGAGDLGAQGGPEGSTSVPWSFSPNDRWLAFHRNQPTTGYDLWVAPVSRRNGLFELGAAKPMLIRPGTQAAPAISPNGKWLAFASEESGRPEVYVTTFSEPDGSAGQSRFLRISTEGGRAPKWDRSGSRIFFRALDERVMAASVSSEGGEFAVQTPIPWSPVAVAAGSGPPNFDVAPDGRRVVGIVEGAEAKPDETHLRILLNVAAKIRAAQNPGKSD